MGVDIGSVTTKGVIVTDSCQPSAISILPSGINYKIAVQKLREELLAKLSLSPPNIDYTVVTGHSMANLPFQSEQVAPMLCCARGISSIFPSARTVIDVEGQSSQVIRLSERGQVINFVVSERCAAGSGRFLEIIANVLRIDLKDIGPLSLKSKNPVTFTTGCAVFGESEAISRVSEGFSKEDILAGVHKSLAGKLSSLVERVGLEEQCAICGGGGLDIGLIKSIEDKLGIKLLVPPQPQLVGALGAAIVAKDRSKNSLAYSSPLNGEAN
jgi:predicted CoA-substrate-specific enzyme activase